MVNWSFLLFCFGSVCSRTKWHGYRHRLANIGGQTQFDFDYYPKFWMSSRTSLQQTLTHMLRRYIHSVNITESQSSELYPSRPVGRDQWWQYSHTVSLIIPFITIEKKRRFFFLLSIVLCCKHTQSKGARHGHNGLFYLGKKRRVCVHITNNRVWERIDPLPATTTIIAQ
jgi:hypothetical protein